SSGGTRQLAATHAIFNGWGGKQVHDGDTQLAGVVARHLGLGLLSSGLVGEGGGVEVDGQGSLLAAASCWVNDNRNPGMSRTDVEESLLVLVGADRIIWVDGLAGADITDGHIDTLARFANPSTIVVDAPAVDDPDDPWVEVAARTLELVEAARTVDGEPYDVVEIVQPTTIRGSGDDFLATYMNYYVCNGAVIAPEFGDEAADAAAREVLASLFPDREIVQLDIDALAAGGGGIHCATQPQPRTS
ncbi:MAG: agmatine deiminase family protein, partial [Ilumatobacteraceae bacterium]